MLSILISKKLFGPTLFLLGEIQIFVEEAVSFLSCQIEGFSLTKSQFPYKIPVFSPFPLSIHLIINHQTNHIKCLTYQPKKQMSCPKNDKTRALTSKRTNFLEKVISQSVLSQKPILGIFRLSAVKSLQLLQFLSQTSNSFCK